MKFLSSVVGLLASASSVLGASLEQVTGFGTNPTTIQMYIYVPSKLATPPPIIVAASSPPPLPLELSRVSCSSGKARLASLTNISLA